MKNFYYQVTFHPCFGRSGNYDGRHSCLYTPTLLDTDKSFAAEDIFMQHVSDKDFKTLIHATAAQATPQAEALAQHFAEETALMYDLSPEEINALALHIQKKAKICAEVYARTQGYPSF